MKQSGDSNTVSPCICYHYVRVSHPCCHSLCITMVTIQADRDHVLCEVCTEVKERAFVIETLCSLGGMSSDC
jgi:hypothetical protein